MATTTLRSMPSPAKVEAGARLHFLGMPFDRVDQAAVLRNLLAAEAGDPFRYIVTPNVDHVIRSTKDPALLDAYEDAFLSVCDSTPIARLAGLLGTKLPLVTGSDLTVRLFEAVMKPSDCVTLIAPNWELAEALARAYPQIRFRAHVPPPGVARQPNVARRCVDFILETSPRFILLAIGSPASEMISHRLSRDPRASGTALCIGASLEFLLERKRRAPVWMRRAGVEWLHRLACEPRRLWRRYLYGVVPLARLFAGELLSRTRRAH